ncbi:MAG TPA: ABC transporter permease [Opitutaceae bacterium]|jgi:ABC-2 type transport system permease protein
MRHFFTILSHEVRMLLVSPATYIAGSAFLAFVGFIFTALLEDYSKAPQDLSPAAVFFLYYWFPVIFMVPLLTMKCLAEERRLGTLETLLTTPVTTAEVVLGKYAAAYLLYLAFWLSTAGYFVILRRFAGDAHLIDPGPIVGGYVFIAVSGLLFVAIGVFSSSLSRNQAVAGMICVTMLVALILGGEYLYHASWLDRESLAQLKAAVDYGHIAQHRQDFTRGIVDMRELLFYVSGTVLALIFSILAVEAKLLHS